MSLFVPFWGKACQNLSRPGVPKTEAEMACVWRALDEDCSGFITICEFDEHCSRILKDFKHYVDKEYGSCVAAYRSADVNRDDKMSVVELGRLIQNCEQFKTRDDIRDLFDAPAREETKEVRSALLVPTPS